MIITKDESKICNLGLVFLEVEKDKLIIKTCCDAFYLTEIPLQDFFDSENVVDLIYNQIKDIQIKNKQLPGTYCIKKLKRCNFMINEKNNLKGLYISLLKSCNLNCKFCCALSTRTNKYDDLYFKVLNKLTEKEYNLEIINLTNKGEPFLYYDKTIDFLKKLNNNITKKIYVITNGINLNKERIDELYNISKEKNIKIEIQVSLNAFNKDTYKNLMGQDYFDKVVENILYLKEKNLLILVSYVVVKENEKEVEDFENFFKKRNITTVTNIAEFLPENYYT